MANWGGGVVLDAPMSCSKRSSMAARRIRRRRRRGRSVTGLGYIGFERSVTASTSVDYEALTGAGKKLCNASAMATRTATPDSTTSTMVTDE